ncbi:type I-E CRISPR-associated protein Cse2/CasB [Aquisalimonas asiatica]|uniref:type I-E CRISPR-associated protein Cse2/CasB n=1 Tax=Aquisalimonas asiatica TaxID=406100 RepID=UPI000B85E816|nr:type I-E CRISPR-associated protein Cse2/CasB [Aquisalimonas asiatica]
MTQPDTNARHPTELVAKLAHVLHAEHFPSGDRAALKRMAIKGRTPLAYHRFLLAQVPEAFHKPKWNTPWRTLICGLAMQHGQPHNASLPLGRALASIDFSESRLEQLLAADEDVLATLVLRAARRLASRRSSANWNDFARLLFASSDAERERINTRIAQDFYRTSGQVEAEPAAT